MGTLISQTDLEAIKAELRRVVTAKNSHRVEAIARGLGYRTNAALRADLTSAPRVCEINAFAFSAYLKGHGVECAPEIFHEAVARALADTSAVMLRFSLPRDKAGIASLAGPPKSFSRW
ncbi:MAG: hypothetical protein AB1744_10705 [Candidatus Zixiibacteriota bacterium]